MVKAKATLEHTLSTKSKQLKRLAKHVRAIDKERKHLKIHVSHLSEEVKELTDQLNQNKANKTEEADSSAPSVHGGSETTVAGSNTCSMNEAQLQELLEEHEDLLLLLAQYELDRQKAAQNIPIAEPMSTVSQLANLNEDRGDNSNPASASASLNPEPAQADYETKTQLYPETPLQVTLQAISDSDPTVLTPAMTVAPHARAALSTRMEPRTPRNSYAGVRPELSFLKSLSAAADPGAHNHDSDQPQTNSTDVSNALSSPFPSHMLQQPSFMTPRGGTGLSTVIEAEDHVLKQSQVHDSTGAQGGVPGDAQSQASMNDYFGSTDSNKQDEMFGNGATTFTNDLNNLPDQW